MEAYLVASFASLIRISMNGGGSIALRSVGHRRISARRRNVRLDIRALLFASINSGLFGLLTNDQSQRLSIKIAGISWGTVDDMRE